VEKVMGTEEAGEAVASFLVGAAELDTLFDGIRGGNCTLEPGHVGAKGVDLPLESGGSITDLGSR